LRALLCRHHDFLERATIRRRGSLRVHHACKEAAAGQHTAQCAGAAARTDADCPHMTPVSVRSSRNVEAQRVALEARAAARTGSVAAFIGPPQRERLPSSSEGAWCLTTPAPSWTINTTIVENKCRCHIILTAPASGSTLARGNRRRRGVVKVLTPTVRKGASFLLYPLLLGGALLLWSSLWLGVGWDADMSMQLVYWLFLALLVVLERVLPFEPAWNRNDGQLRNDIVLSIVTIALNSLATIVCLGAIAWAIARIEPLVSLQVWPAH